MKFLSTLIFLIPFIGFGQLYLGDSVCYTRDNIEFTFKKPLPFEESNNAYGADEESLVISFFNQKNRLVIQIHSNPIRKEFQNDFNKLMNDFEMARSIYTRVRPPIDEIVSFEKININNRPFYELKYIKNYFEMQITWITVYKNRLISIYGGTTLSNFENVEFFLNNFKEHIALN